MLGDPLSVSTPSDTQVLLVRSFAAPPHLVFACYTQPSLIRRWLTGPDRWTMPVCAYDAREGGGYRFEWHGPRQGDFLAVSGKISRIDAMHYIDSSELFDGGVMGPAYRTELRFDLDGPGTDLVNTLTCTSQAHRDMVVATGMADGMEMSFQTLDQLLAAELG
ncbi:SRPBCC domain-containing protein [Devosia sediminis]|uniref:SRPBCC domain-containing protein n=1 Tax=Devosia sediminis TaxID=2798801 RepID=A0A934IW87_9HYPH|nr:SRPBCC domain-containing protein [Devosia sediminis]MBJ3783943.1 SRPBCC domain-containing protein [Devosia sediminis]